MDFVETCVNAVAIMLLKFQTAKDVEKFLSRFSPNEREQVVRAIIENYHNL